MYGGTPGSGRRWGSTATVRRQQPGIQPSPSCERQAFEWERDLAEFQCNMIEGWSRLTRRQIDMLEELRDEVKLTNAMLRDARQELTEGAAPEPPNPASAASGMAPGRSAEAKPPRGSLMPLPHREEPTC
jgi:hypothetical protein